MFKTTYVIGHRNPDTDSMAAAIAYAALKKRLGDENIVAAMAGAPNLQTRYILERLGIEEPLFLADVHPKVRDTLKMQPVSVDRHASAYEALELFNKSGVRVLPVLENGIPCGVLSLLRLSESYLLRNTVKIRQVVTTLPNLVRTLAATVVAGSPEDELITLNLFIGAMMEESFNSRITGFDPAELLIMTGNRRTIQLAAIERGVRLLVITGGHVLDQDLCELAQNEGVTVLLTPHDTATAAWLARLSTPAFSLADTQFTVIGVDKSLAVLRQKLMGANLTAVLAVEGDGRLAGVATKSSLLAPLPYQLILVDHNELGQAVPGAEQVEIVEVIDHHKLGNSHSSTPISFITSPVGSSCTLVAERYRMAGLEPEQKIAALLLAGILSDTVIMKSPTTTTRDINMAEWLETLSGLTIADFGHDIFAASSSLKSYGSVEQIISADFKLFTHEKYNIGLGQVEVIGFEEFYGMKDDLLKALAKIKERDNLFIAGLMVTDITSESTLFLVEGHTRIAHVMEYPMLEPHLYQLKNVMSRKKQMVPHLLKILAKV